MGRLGALARPLAVRDFRLLWVAQAASDLGDWAARLAMSVLVLERTGSPFLAGLVTAVSVLPWIGLGQVLAALGDRMPRRTVLVAADLARAGLFLAMLAPVGVPGLLALAFAAGAAGPAFQAARSALLPEVLPGERYADGLAVTQITNQMGTLGGFLAGGWLVAVAGAGDALAANAGTFVVSAAVIAAVRTGRGARTKRPVGAQMREGLRTLRGDAYLFRAAALVAVAWIGAAAAEALVAVYARDTGGSAAAAGALAATIPLGGVLGAALIRRGGDHARLLRVCAWTIIAGSAVAGAGFATEVGLPGAAVPYLGVGLICAIMVPANAVAGRRIPDDRRAAVFGLLQGSLIGCVALGAAAGGRLAAAIGAGPACALMLLPGLLYAAYTLLSPVRPAPPGKPAEAVEPVSGISRSGR